MILFGNRYFSVSCRPIIVLPPMDVQVIYCEHTEAEKDFYEALFKRSKVAFCDLWLKTLFVIILTSALLSREFLTNFFSRSSLTSLLSKAEFFIIMLPFWSCSCDFGSVVIIHFLL